MDMFLGTHGGSTLTCAPRCGTRCGLAPGPSSAFQGNDFGLQVHPTARVATVHAAQAAASAAATAAAASAASAAPAAPRSYEASTLFGFMGQLDDGASGVWDARTVRARDGFAIGRAVHAASGQEEGFLTQVHPAADATAVLPTTVLVCPQADGTTIHLLFPRALLVRRAGGSGGYGSGGCCSGGCSGCGDGACGAGATAPCMPEAVLGTVVVVAGNGSLVAADGTTTLLADEVVIGTVPVNACGVAGPPRLFIGNGAVWGAADDCTYHDMQWCPYQDGAVYVCGSAGPAAAVALVSLQTGLGLAGTVLPGVAAAVGVSLALANGLLSVGVNVGEGSTADALVWSLVPASGQAPFASVAPYPLALNTQYNAAATGRLRRPDHATALVIIKVLAHTCGGLVVVARATMDAGSGTPSQVAAMYGFDGSTAPLGTFGPSGVMVWWAPDGGTTASTQPTDALLGPDGGLIVVGNAFPPAQQAAPLQFQYDTTTQLTTTPPVGAPPRPWALQVCACAPSWACCCCDGAVAPGVRCLVRDLPGCSFARLVNCVYLSNPRCMHLVGDVFPHGCGAPAQAAQVLNAVVGTCPARVLNAGPAVPWATGVAPPPADGGPMRVDYACGAGAYSTLVVAGPVVVGAPCASNPQTPLPIPGSLMFNPATRAFMGYDGTAWRDLAWASTPP